MAKDSTSNGILPFNILPGLSKANSLPLETTLSESPSKFWLRQSVESLSIENPQLKTALGSMWKLIDGEIPQSKDLLRETSLRYLGYANEIGEAFQRFLTPTLYKMSYVVAAGYVVADSVDKGWRAYLTWKAEQLAKDDPLSPDFNKKGDSPMPIITAVADTLVWQSLASVFIPGFAINRAVWASELVLETIPKLPIPLRRWGPTMVGLSLIPLIVHPIDESVTWFMERTVRRYYGADKSHQS